METYKVYIITDSNRTYLKVGHCAHIADRLQEIQHASSALFNSSPKLSNLVYIESFADKEKALAYYNTLCQFTRMQREKLIRLKNPDWLNLWTVRSTSSEADVYKKTVVYA